MRKDKLTKIVIKHGNKIKIIGTILAVITMIVATRTYINYNTIIEAIQKVQYDISSVEEEIAYSKNFLKPYLDSEYAGFFLAHKNNILFDGEYIIRFQAPIESSPENEEIKNENLIKSPQQSRKHFIKSKMGTK